MKSFQSGPSKCLSMSLIIDGAREVCKASSDPRPSVRSRDRSRSFPQVRILVRFLDNFTLQVSCFFSFGSVRLQLNSETGADAVADIFCEREREKNTQERPKLYI